MKVFILLFLILASTHGLQFITKYTNAIRNGVGLSDVVSDNFKIITCDSNFTINRKQLEQKYQSTPKEYFKFRNYTVLDSINYDGGTIIYMVNVSGISINFYEVHNWKLVSETQRDCKRAPITTTLIDDESYIANVILSRYLAALQNSSSSQLQEVLAEKYAFFSFSLRKDSRDQYIKNVQRLESTGTWPISRLRIHEPTWLSEIALYFYVHVLDEQLNATIAETYFDANRDFKITYESQFDVFEPLPQCSALIKKVD